MGETEAVISDFPVEVESVIASISQPLEVETQPTLDEPPGFPLLTSSSLDVQLNTGADLVSPTSQIVGSTQISSLGDNSFEMPIRKLVNGGKDLPSTTKIDGAWLVKFAAAAVIPEIPSGETVKRKRGRPPVKNKVNEVSPLVSSPTSVKSLAAIATEPNGKKKGGPLPKENSGVSLPTASPNANELTLTELVKGKGRKPVKKRRGTWSKKRGMNKAVSVKSPIATSTTPTLLATETSLEKPVKRKGGRPAKLQKTSGKTTGIEESVSVEPSLTTSTSKPVATEMGISRAVSVESPLATSTAPTLLATEVSLGTPTKRKGGRPPKIQSPAKKTGINESASLEPSHTAPTAAPVVTEMPSTESMKRKAGRPPNVKRKYVRKKGNTARQLAPSLQTNDQSTTPETRVRVMEKHVQDGGRSLTPSPTPKSTPKRGTKSPSKNGKRQKLALDADSSRSLKEAGKDYMEVVTVLQPKVYVGDIPIPVEYEQIYKEIADRHGPLENGEKVSVGLSYSTVVELLKMANELKALVMESVTDTTIGDFERNIKIGKLFNYNVGWLEENLKRLSDLYAKRCAVDVARLEQDVQSCNTWLEATQEELSRMEEAYLAAKKNVDDLVKSRDDAVAKLVAARDCLGKFEFVI